MTINNRIDLLINTLKMNNNSFSVKLGVSPTIIHNIIKGRNAPSYDIIQKIVLSFDNINTNWLITGAGEMFANDYGTKLEKCLTVAKENVPLYKSNDLEGIPLLPINAMAGFFQGETKILEHECDRYVVPIFKEAEFLIPVKGSSMYPKYNSGDIVACKRMPLDTFFQWNKVYVLDTEQGALIKRVKKGNNDESIMIVSDNANYEPFELKRSKIYNIALVVGVIRLE